MSSTSHGANLYGSRRLSLWAPVAAYMAAIFYFSSLSSAPLPPGLTDKPSHALAYLGLAIVVVRALTGGLPPRVTTSVALASLAITIAYGASDELHQTFVPGRTAELNDLVADGIGAAVGTAACWAWGIIAFSFRPNYRPRQ